MELSLIFVVILIPWWFGRGSTAKTSLGTQKLSAGASHSYSLFYWANRTIPSPELLGIRQSAVHESFFRDIVPETVFADLTCYLGDICLC